LSGANLSWANLSEAKLSGANLTGADLTHANLLNTSLVHADLTQARLIHADWIGADLTGATLTGAKLHGVSRVGLKTQGIVCEWVDLSPEGDHSRVVNISSEEISHKFFNETLPTVTILIDAPLDIAANLALVRVYHQLAQTFPVLNTAPNVNVGVRKTSLTFSASNSELLIIAYLGIVPFNDATITQQNIITLLNKLEDSVREKWGFTTSQSIQEFRQTLNQGIDQSKMAVDFRKSSPFFQAPTQTIITNSHNQTWTAYYHPAFGKPLMQSQ